MPFDELKKCAKLELEIISGFWEKTFVIKKLNVFQPNFPKVWWLESNLSDRFLFERVEVREGSPESSCQSFKEKTQSRFKILHDQSDSHICNKILHPKNQIAAQLCYTIF